jgi:hypothetical protein
MKASLTKPCTVGGEPAPGYRKTAIDGAAVSGAQWDPRCAAHHPYDHTPPGGWPHSARPRRSPCAPGIVSHYCWAPRSKPRQHWVDTYAPCCCHTLRLSISDTDGPSNLLGALYCSVGLLTRYVVAAARYGLGWSSIRTGMCQGGPGEVCPDPPDRRRVRRGAGAGATHAPRAGQQGQRREWGDRPL